MTAIQCRIGRIFMNAKIMLRNAVIIQKHANPT